MTEVTREFIIDVLRVFAELDAYEPLRWRTDGKYAPVTFFVNCNDLFWWATADAETITPENLPVLRQAIIDADVDYADWGFPLFCARVRGMRPQQPAYPKDERLRALFDACGPERTRAEEG